MDENGYKKGSFCILGGCVEIKHDAAGIKIRHSAKPEKVICVSSAEWDAFIKSVKAGEFDLNK